MSETVVLKVKMSCQGCSGAVNRVLSKMEGVESFDINLEQQKVTVKGNVTPESVLHTVSKTGKATSFWEATETVPKPNEPEAKPQPESKPNEPEAKPQPESKPNESGSKPNESGSKPTTAA